MTLGIVNLPLDYFPDPNKGRPIFNGQIFVGEPDLDPQILANRKDIVARQEDGTEIPISPAEQPVRTSAGGVPTYNGATVQILVEGNYSIKVLDKGGAQEYFWTNYNQGLPLVVGDEGKINHGLLLDKDAVGAHDTIYRRKTTVAEIESGVFAIGDLLTVTDRSNAPFDVEALLVNDGFSVIDAVGKSAVLNTLLYDFIDPTWLGAVGVDVTGTSTVDVTDEFNATCNLSRLTGRRVYVPGKEFRINGSVDFSGTTFGGDLGGYGSETRSARLIGDGTNTLLIQTDVSLSGLISNVRNLNISNVNIGIKINYAVHSRYSNITITDSFDGLVVGDAAFVGCLFCMFENFDVTSTNIGLTMRGNQWCNANTFTTSLFKGGVAGGDIKVTSGFGAVDNTFDAVEFTGDGYGLVLFNANGTSLTNCYFESKGSHIVGNGAVQDLQMKGCVHGSLRSDAVGGGAYILHNNNIFSFDVSVTGGKIFANSGNPLETNLTFIKSINPTLCFVHMTNLPSLTGVAGLSFLSDTSIIQELSYLNLSDTYTPDVTISGTSIVGDGVIIGDWSVNGNQVYVTIKFTIGSTTDLATSGNWLIVLPFDSKYRANGNVRMVDSASRNYIGLIQVTASNNVAVIYESNSGLIVSRVAPFTWAVGDEIQISILYPLD